MIQKIDYMLSLNVLEVILIIFLATIYGIIISYLINKTSKNDKIHFVLKYIPFKKIRKMFYRRTTYKDIKNKTIREGDIIRVCFMLHWYGKPFDNFNTCYCVVFDEFGEPGSCIKDDWESLNEYEAIEILGHVEDYRKTSKKYEIYGNFYEALK